MLINVVCHRLISPIKSFIEAESPDGLQRDFGGEVRREAEIEAVFGKIAAGLTHHSVAAYFALFDAVQSPGIAAIWGWRATQLAPLGIAAVRHHLVSSESVCDRSSSVEAKTL